MWCWYETETADHRRCREIAVGSALADREKLQSGAWLGVRENCSRGSFRPVLALGSARRVVLRTSTLCRGGRLLA